MASVCVVSYRAPDLLRDCLASVYRAAAGQPIEIIVVDNSETAECESMLQRDFPAVVALRSGRNLGFSRAMNRAIAKASAEYVLVLNPDTVLRDDAFAMALARLTSSERIAVVGAHLLCPDGSTDWASRRSFPTPRDLCFRTLHIDRVFPGSPVIARYARTFVPYEISGPVECVSGAFMFVRMEAIRQVGFFDERFFMYAEDLDWSRRFEAAGWVVFYDANVVVHHVKHGTARQRPVRMRLEYYRSLYQLYCKHYGGAPRRERYAFLTLCVVAGLASAVTAFVRGIGS